MYTADNESIDFTCVMLESGASILSKDTNVFSCSGCADVIKLILVVVSQDWIPLIFENHLSLKPSKNIKGSHSGNFGEK